MITILDFDRQYLLLHQGVLQQIAVLYCDIFENDINFAEYRQCLNCKRTYSQAEIADQVTCPECDKLLVEVWNPIQVALTLLESAKSHSFKGVLAIDTDLDQVVGFAWGRLFSTDEMHKQWGAAYDNVSQQNPDACYSYYIEEIAVKNGYRGNGIGTKLLKRLIQKPFASYRSQTGTFDTHRNSAMFSMGKKLGFKEVEDQQNTDGRVHMAIDQIQHINIFV